MADITDILEQYIDRAELLAKEGKVKDAFTLCRKVLEADPENSRALSLERLIEEAIRNINDQAIDQKIEALKPLWEQGAYDQIIRELKEMYHYAPHNPKLESALAQAEALYRGAVEKQSMDKTQQYAVELEEIFVRKEYDTILETIQKNQRFAGEEPKVQKIHDQYRKKIVSARLEEKKELFKSEKYEDIVNFLYGLQHIDPQNADVLELLRTYRKKLLEQQLDSKQDYILKAEQNIKTLYQLGKFDKAVEACDELLRTDAGNKLAASTKKEAQAKYAAILQEETENFIAKTATDLSAEQKQHPEDFISI